ncbi:MAG: hypothetical protein MI755_20405 [Sphingomonadales bacterium]|nr:hypothetical protein [Sphingomonadales bacterium]
MSTFMYRVAELEKRRGWLWAGICAVVIVTIGQWLSSTYLSSFGGATVTFMMMTIANVIKPVNKGPFH